MEDLRNVLADVIAPDADLEDLRDARRCVANLDPATVRLVLDQALQARAAAIRAELD